MGEAAGAAGAYSKRRAGSDKGGADPWSAHKAATAAADQKAACVHAPALAWRHHKSNKGTQGGPRVLTSGVDWQLLWRLQY